MSVANAEKFSIIEAFAAGEPGGLPVLIPASSLASAHPRRAADDTMPVPNRPEHPRSSGTAQAPARRSRAYALLRSVGFGAMAAFGVKFVADLVEPVVRPFVDEGS